MLSFQILNFIPQFPDFFPQAFDLTLILMTPEASSPEHKSKHEKRENHTDDHPEDGKYPPTRTPHIWTMLPPHLLASPHSPALLLLIVAQSMENEMKNDSIQH
jgi:hypothetical protein